MTLLVVTGASGFLGRHFLNSIAATQWRVRALTRARVATGWSGRGVDWVTGDISSPGTWPGLLEPGCTVVNLAYSQDADLGEALSATERMVEVCASTGVARLIHCSTISVYGRASDTVRTEQTPCNPTDEYGRIKLAIEQTLIGSARNGLEVAVLRPAEVFGEGGKALRSLCSRLTGGSKLMNYCRSTLLARRRMHLVPVETVVAAIRFLCETRKPLLNEIFIVSDDEDPLNNFRDVERILMEQLRLPYYQAPLLPLPRFLLECGLRLRRRSGIDSRSAYLCSKLLDWGFAKPIAFETALRNFADAYDRTRMPQRGP